MDYIHLYLNERNNWEALQNGHSRTLGDACSNSQHAMPISPSMQQDHVSVSHAELDAS